MEEKTFFKDDVPKFKDVGSDNLGRLMVYGPKVKDYLVSIRSGGRTLIKSEYEKFIIKLEKLAKSSQGLNFMYHGKALGKTTIDELIKLIRKHLGTMAKDPKYKRRECLTELLGQLKECQLCNRLLITDTHFKCR